MIPNAIGFYRWLEYRLVPGGRRVSRVHLRGRPRWQSSIECPGVLGGGPCVHRSEGARYADLPAIPNERVPLRRPATQHYGHLR